VAAVRVNPSSTSLRVTAGPATGSLIQVDEEFLVGRSQAGDGALGGDSSLSELHARVARGASGGWEISDFGSDAGTFLNGRSLSGSAQLYRGDMLRMGNSRLLVLQGSPRPAAIPARPPAAAGPASAASQPPAEAPSEPIAAQPVQAAQPVEPVQPDPPPYEPPALPEPPAHRIAPLRRRWRAAVIDNVLLFPLAFGLSRVFGGALIAIAAALALTLIYDFLCESLRGQTIGKRATKIRVVRRDGSSLRPQHCAARNVLRFIDTIPGVPLVGLLSITASGKERRQRLGDLAAGTVVVESEPRRARLPADRRDRLVLAAYPFAWVAPVVALALFSPTALTRPCGKTMPTGDGKCLFRSVDGHLASAVYAQSGHTLRWNRFAIRALGATAVKLNSRQYIEGVELAVTN